ncbi:MAG TPA: TetR/AcrR family transcriptional regulator [Tissierellaceae bacterium]|nr:TetR/AcrR family transcriptional regulator [Tissierellaceae bacterium]
MNKNNKRRRMTKEERRKQILDSAMKVFIEKGYNGATTLDIAKEAEISEVTLFRYFSSKKELFMNGIEPILITTLEESLVASKDLQPIEKLRSILKDRIQFISKHHEIIKLILMESQINPEVADFNYIDKITSLLKDSIKETGIEFEDEEVSLRLVMGSILSFLYLPEIDEDEIDNYIDKFIQTIIN